MCCQREPAVKRDAYGLRYDSCLHVNIMGWHRHPSGWGEVEVGREASPGQAPLVGWGKDQRGAWPGVRSSSLIGIRESLQSRGAAKEDG